MILRSNAERTFAASAVDVIKGVGKGGGVVGVLAHFAEWANKNVPMEICGYFAESKVKQNK